MKKRQEQKLDIVERALEIARKLTDEEKEKLILSCLGKHEGTKH